MRRPTVLSLPPQLVFLAFKVNNEQGEYPNILNRTIKNSNLASDKLAKYSSY
jgi:hypothetical protein